MVRDRSSEEDEDAVSPPDGRGRPGDCGVGNRLLAVVLAGVGSRRAVLPPLAGRWTNASTLDSNIGAARRAATFLDRLALVMAWLGLGGYRPLGWLKMTNEFEVSMIPQVEPLGKFAMAGPEEAAPKATERPFSGSLPPHTRPSILMRTRCAC